MAEVILLLNRVRLVLSRNLLATSRVNYKIILLDSKIIGNNGVFLRNSPRSIYYELESMFSYRNRDCGTIKLIGMFIRRLDRVGFIKHFSHAFLFLPLRPFSNQKNLSRSMEVFK